MLRWFQSGGKSRQDAGRHGTPLRPCPPPTAWAPPLPTEAERHAVPRRPALLAHRGLNAWGVQVFDSCRPTMQPAADSGVDASGRPRRRPVGGGHRHGSIYPSGSGVPKPRTRTSGVPKPREAYPPDRLTENPCALSSSITRSTWSPWISRVPSLAVPPDPQAVRSCLPSAASATASSGKPFMAA